MKDITITIETLKNGRTTQWIEGEYTPGMEVGAGKGEFSKDSWGDDKGNGDWDICTYRITNVPEGDLDVIGMFRNTDLPDGGDLPTPYTVDYAELAPAPKRCTDPLTAFLFGR